MVVLVARNLSNCIAADIKDEEGFKRYCPDPKVILTDKWHLKMKSETLAEDKSINEHQYTFSETARIGYFYQDDTNIYEQLKLNLNGCSPHLNYIIFQVFYISNRRAEYGYLFIGYGNQYFGYIMVPYKAMSRSLILTETQYKIFNRTFASFIKIEQINEFIKCDLNTLWEESCLRNMETRVWFNTNLIWSGVIIILVY